MSLEKSFIQLRKEDIEYLKLFFRQYTYNISSTLFYRDQIPVLSFLLLGGKIELKRNKTSLDLPHYTLIGLRELFYNQPAKYQAAVFAGSQILSLDKFTFCQFLQENPRYYQIFNLEVL